MKGTRWPKVLGRREKLRQRKRSARGAAHRDQDIAQASAANRVQSACLRQSHGEGLPRWMVHQLLNSPYHQTIYVNQALSQPVKITHNGS